MPEPMFSKAKTYTPCQSSEALAARADAMTALGYKVKAHQKGFKATRLYFGKWWLHLPLFIFTQGIGNLLYLTACLLGRKTEVVYLNVAPDKQKKKEDEAGEDGIPAWVEKAFRKHLRRGTPGYEPQPLYSDPQSKE